MCRITRTSQQQKPQNQPQERRFVCLKEENQALSWTNPTIITNPPRFKPFELKAKKKEQCYVLLPLKRSVTTQRKKDHLTNLKPPQNNPKLHKEPHKKGVRIPFDHQDEKRS
ncbi:hypothetical protein LIER_27909 [Lithospermum erythrorhizon]|uniref:Uncharacterized protein n=1 Tax=Lithospermum erythrorhizon TaxID=34254 RepID=A0AAV3RE12_LITER